MNKFMYVYLAIPLIYSLLFEVEFLRPMIHTLSTIMNMYIQVAIHKDHLNFSKRICFPNVLRHWLLLLFIFKNSASTIVKIYFCI